MKYLKVFITLILLQQAAFAQMAASSSGLKNLLQKFVEVYNTGDSTAYRNYLASVFSDPGRVASNLRQTNHEYSFTGKTRLMQIKQVSPSQAEALLQTERYDSWWKILLITDSAQHYQEHHMMPVRLSADFLKKGALSQQQIFLETDKYIARLMQNQVFAGNVLIAKNGKVLYTKSFGNNTQGQPNTSTQRFGLASMGKLFTTVSILQLVDRKLLSLDDQIGKLLPELKNDALKPITIKQLLTHTSGMGDFFENPRFEPKPGQIISKKDYLTAIEEDKLHFEPGKGFRYSNTGFLLLALIVERLSGTDFNSYVQQNIFNKAGMTNSTSDSGAGGGESTIADLYTFSKALRNGKLLGPASTTELFTYHTNQWGLGAEYQQLGNEVIIGHSGGFIGVCTELNIYKNSGYTVIILSNTEPPYGHYLSDKIKELIIRS